MSRKSALAYLVGNGVLDNRPQNISLPCGDYTLCIRGPFRGALVQSQSSLMLSQSRVNTEIDAAGEVGR